MVNKEKHLSHFFNQQICNPFSDIDRLQFINRETGDRLQFQIECAADIPNTRIQPKFDETDLPTSRVILPDLFPNANTESPFTGNIHRKDGNIYWTISDWEKTFNEIPNGKYIVSETFVTDEGRVGNFRILNGNYAYFP